MRTEFSSLYEFEDFWSKENSIFGQDDEFKNFAYGVWQASRAALVVELPPLEKYYGGKHFSTKIYAAKQFATDVNLAIRAAGITVKE